MMKYFRAGFVAACLVATTAALAHHSYQMFDTGKEVTFHGTLKGVEWTNPHIWIQVMITDKDGKKIAPQEWAFEGGGSGGYQRAGWRTKHFVPGTPVTVIGNPLRNGQAGGNLVNMTFPNKAVLGRGQTRPDGTPAAQRPAAPSE